jgi:hypothetical protein
MNCSKFQEVLPEVLEDGRNAEQESHLRSCPVCSSLVADLNLIAREARQLQEFDEPSPRVWNSIEITLRQEGIIRDPHLGPTLLPPVPRRWSLSWLVPVAAILLVGIGFVFYQRPPQPSASLTSPTAPAITDSRIQNSHSSLNKVEDEKLLAAVDPAMKEQYASNLRNVDAYIQDAEASAKADPNDEEAQEVVMDAYQQRATVYEMALDRSLP